MDAKSLEQITSILHAGASLRTHSGQVVPGDVFVAMAGIRVDGTQYIDEAIKRGAIAVVHNARALVQPQTGVMYVPVDNPAQTLGELAPLAFGTQGRMPRVVGITGTNGKTTTAHLVHYLLEHNNLSAGLLGTVHYSWPGVSIPASMTTPDGLALHQMVGQMVQGGVGYLVMEISSHALDQERMAGLPVEVGVFTNLTQDHLDYHQDMESYFQAKARLFGNPPQGCALGVVNMDDPYGLRLKKARPELMGYGLGQADLHGEILSAGTWGTQLRMKYQGQSWELHTTLVGRHNAYNLLASQGAGLLLGLGIEQLACLADAPGAPGRLERVTNNRGLDIFVDYAHTPDALENVSLALKSMGFARLIVAFGCGGDRDARKRPLMGRAVSRYADVAVLTSDNPRTEDPQAIMNQVLPGLAGSLKIICEKDRRKAIGLAISCMNPGDALLIAGKGHEDYQIVGTEKRHFSDFEVVQEYLS